MKKILLLSVLSPFLLMGCNVTGGLVLDSGFYAAPLAHAPAHDRRAQHRYQYYPNAEFYFDITRNTYFYLDSNAQWTFSVNLPFRLRHHLHNNYVEIEMDDARPYRRHKHYKNKYRKHKTKYHRKYNKKHKYKNERKHGRKHNSLDDGSYKSEKKNGRKHNSLDDGSYKNKKKYKSRKKKHRKYDDEDE